MSALSDLAQREAARAILAMPERWVVAGSRELATTALGALDHPEVLAGIAGVLAEHAENRHPTGFLPECRCGWIGSSDLAWAVDHAKHQTEALVAALTGKARQA